MPIDVGPGCLDLPDIVATNRTYVSQENPSNETGTIDYFCVWVWATAPEDQRVASFEKHFVNPNDLQTNDWVSLANPGSGGKHEYNAPGDFTAFDINTNEYIGYCCSQASLKVADLGTPSSWYLGSSHIPTAGFVTFGVSDDAVSMYATGICGWEGKFMGIVNADIGKIMGIDITDIEKVMGV